MNMIGASYEEREMEDWNPAPATRERPAPLAATAGPAVPAALTPAPVNRAPLPPPPAHLPAGFRPQTGDAPTKV